MKMIIPEPIRRFPLLLILFLTAGSLLSEGEEVRIATFNLRNYLLEDRRVEGRWRPDYPKPEKEKRAVWEILKEVDPDILILQEMGTTPFLDELRADLEKMGISYPYADVVDAADEKRHLAILSRYPYRLTEGFRALDFPYFGERIPVKRGLLEAHFEIGGYAFTVFGVHLKSRYTDNREDPDSVKRRRGEARVLRDYIRDQFPRETSPDYLLVGDFNDTRRSSTLNYFLTISDRELTRMVPATDGRGETWTYYYGAEDVYSRIDFILATPSLLNRIIGGRAHIVDSEAALTASDHRMVYLDLAIGKQKSD